jgi:uncharacterized 2Fe-2S/4Fe-4S cluster protein (DUF4445 family)
LDTRSVKIFIETPMPSGVVAYRSHWTTLMDVMVDVKYAMVLGMIPDCKLDNVSSAGNAAGTGARIALLDQRSRGDIESLVRRVEKIETAVEPRFQEFFVEAMAIPHLTAPFEQLRKAVTLPERTAATTDAAPRGRRPSRRG